MRCRAIAWSAWLALVAFGATIGTVRAGDDAGEKAGRDYSGVVLDPTGSPAVDCKLWLCRVNLPDPIEVVEEAATDAQGRFAMHTLRLLPTTGAQSYLTLFARDAQGRIGFPRPKVEPGTRAPPTDKEAKFQLVEVGECRGRLVDRSGQPIASVAVEPFYLTDSEFDKPTRQPIFIPPCVAKELEFDSQGNLHEIVPRMPDFQRSPADGLHQYHRASRSGGGQERCDRRPGPG